MYNSEFTTRHFALRMQEDNLWIPVPERFVLPFLLFSESNALDGTLHKLEIDLSSYLCFPHYFSAKREWRKKSSTSHRVIFTFVICGLNLCCNTFAGLPCILVSEELHTHNDGTREAAKENGWAFRAARAIIQYLSMGLKMVLATRSAAARAITLLWPEYLHYQPAVCKHTTSSLQGGLSMFYPASIPGFLRILQQSSCEIP